MTSESVMYLTLPTAVQIDGKRLVWFHAKLLSALIDAVAGVGGAVFWTVGVVAKGHLLAILPIFLNMPLDSKTIDEVISQVVGDKMAVIFPQEDKVVAGEGA